jgi:hypothetical protein
VLVDALAVDVELDFELPQPQIASGTSARPVTRVRVRTARKASDRP